MNWQKDLDYESRFVVDEIYFKIDKNNALLERLRIVKYPTRSTATIFYSKKTNNWIDPDTGETFIETDDKEYSMSYGEAKNKFFYGYDDEAYEIINSFEDLF